MRTSIARGLVVGLVLALCGPDASAAPGKESTRFSSAAVGISLAAPAGWKTLSMREIASSGPKRLPDEQLLDALEPLGGKPLVEFAKHDEPYAELNPTIQINVRALGGFAKRPIEEVLSTVVIPLRRQHPEIELVGPAKELKVSGLKALQATAKYKLTLGPRQLDVRSQLLVVPRGAVFFVIAMTDPPEGADVAAREFQAALASIHIDP